MVLASNYDEKGNLDSHSGGGILVFQASLTTSRGEAALGKLKEKMLGKEKLFVGIDLHKQRWHETIRTLDTKVFSASLPGTWEAFCSWTPLTGLCPEAVGTPLHFHDCGHLWT